jgi:hypothetical protein
MRRRRIITRREIIVEPNRACGLIAKAILARIIAASDPFL